MAPKLDAKKISSDALEASRKVGAGGLEASKKAVATSWKLLTSSLSRIVLFLFVATPVYFLILMNMGGYLLSYELGWDFVRGYNFMAGAITGGAIVMPASPPDSTGGKVMASIAGAAGVGLFGFMVAIISNSAVDPLINVFGLNSDVQSTRNFFGKLCGMATIVMVTNLAFAAVFGWVLSFVEPGMGLEPSIKAMASVELGGGVVFQNQGYPSTAAGSTFYIIIGVGVIGVSTLMISVVGGPATSMIEKATGITLGEGATARSAAQMLGFVCAVILPLVLLGVMLLVGVVMSLATGWAFTSAFWAGLPATTGGACALSADGSPNLTVTGNVILVCTASAGFFLVTLFVGVGSEISSPIIDTIEYLREKKTLAHACFALFVIAFVAIPLAVFLFALPIGAVIAHVEGWKILDGFWWSVAVQLGGGMALTDAHVESMGGMLLGTVAVAWSIGVSIMSVGLSSSPVVEPLLDAMGMTINEEELSELLGKCNFKKRRSPRKIWDSYSATSTSSQA